MVHQTLPIHARRANSRHGAVTVEFAIVASLFFLLLLGSGEFVRIAMIRHEIQSIAYEAASLAVLPGVSDEQVEEKARSLLETAGLTNCTTSVARESAVVGEGFVTVEVIASLEGYAWFTPAVQSLGELRGVATLKSQRPRSLTEPAVQTALDGLGLSPSSREKFRFDVAR